MIATRTTPSLLVRLLAPLVWRSKVKTAAKLDEFASTEAGSALDMLKAAELCEEPILRRLFFRHALDEARHAQMFRDGARQLVVDAHRRASSYSLIHARRQNLFERLGLLRFIAFVYVAEKRGEAQFRALAKHFERDPHLGPLFSRIAKDERFHVAYSAKLLAEWSRAGNGRAVRWALMRVQASRALEAWRRAGRLLGDAVGRIALGLVYLVVLPLFVVFSRLSDRAPVGWVSRRSGDTPASLPAARRQS
jgi:rubrerythrin